MREVLVDDDAKQATVIVPDDQLSLAIGREGQNARLAARLTGWRVDIRSETEFAAEEAEHAYEEEEVTGRCAAILSNGRRCPNASLPGSRYCGLETHQALANIDSDNVGDLNGGAGEEPASPAAEQDAPALDLESEPAPIEAAAPEVHPGDELIEEPASEEVGGPQGDPLAQAAVAASTPEAEAPEAESAEQTPEAEVEAAAEESTT